MASSYPTNSTLRPRVAQSNHPLVHLVDEEANRMSARFAATFPPEKKWPVSAVRLLFVYAPISFGRQLLGQTTASFAGLGCSAR